MKLRPRLLLQALLTAGAVWLSLGVMVAQLPSSPTRNANQNTNRSDLSTTPQNLAIENLILLSQTAPPEVAADLLLSLAASQGAMSKTRKKEVIEDAFRIATNVREPLRRKAWSAIVDTRSGLKQAAFELELDKMSLQSKAVLQMISLDRARARMMFQDITLPTMKTLTCEDALGYDFLSYYRAAWAVSVNCFEVDERKVGLHVQFLADRLSEVKSEAQIAAAATMITSGDTSPEELSLLLTRFIEAIGRISHDARSLAFAIRYDRLIPILHRLILMSRQRGLPATELSQSVRSHLIKQMSGETCVDAPWLEDRQPKLSPDLVQLNEEFDKPIMVDDMRPLSIGPSAIEVVYWTTPRAKDLLKRAKELRFGSGPTALSSEERQTDEWRKKLDDFLALIESWDPSTEASADDYFKEKCILYSVMVDLCPDDAQRDVILRAYSGYLSERNREYKGRIDWILPVKHYLQRLQAKTYIERRKSLDPWLTSSDPALRIYAEFSLLK